jgi:hypothetical protein
MTAADKPVPSQQEKRWLTVRFGQGKDRDTGLPESAD